MPFSYIYAATAVACHSTIFRLTRCVYMAIICDSGEHTWRYMTERE